MKKYIHKDMFEVITVDKEEDGFVYFKFKGIDTVLNSLRFHKIFIPYHDNNKSENCDVQNKQATKRID